MADLPKVCEHINLPVQAGDDEVLRRMRRPYTTAEYRDIISEIRDTIPDVTISTDIIVGFPGETEEQYENTLRLVDDLRFDKVHGAAYSTRPGTIAARTMDDDVPQEEKQRRLKGLETLAGGHPHRHQLRVPARQGPGACREPQAGQLDRPDARQQARLLRSPRNRRLRRRAGPDRSVGGRSDHTHRAMVFGRRDGVVPLF